MNKLLITLVLALCVIGTVGFTRTPAPVQWEYKFEYKCHEKGANELAGQGWELVSSTTYTYSNVIIQMCAFKRQKH